MEENHPVIRAWRKYLVDHDVSALISAVLSVAGEDYLSFIMWLAVGECDWSLVSRLQDVNIQLKFEGDESSLLCNAIQFFGDVPDALKWLIDHGARIDGRSINDWTALHFASRRGYLGVVRVLVDNGADVDAITSVDGGWTPLMEASAGGHKDVVAFLLSKGADPTIVNSFERCDAHGIAVRKGNSEVADLLEYWMSPKNKVRLWKDRKKTKRERG